MGQALYRKYRSRALNEIVGQEHITATLARAIKAGRVSHAYLFTGPRGTGKTSVARILAHEINGLPYADTPHLDIIEIDAASNRRIDDIRDLREKVHIAPISAQYKVYIIDEVHMLTGESFNALLKTLEEPPSHVVFILATTEVHKLPATIISRTQRYAFRAGSVKQVAKHLQSIAKKEGINIEDAALELIAEHGEGSYRDSVSLLDQLAHITDAKITETAVADALGLAPKTQIAALSEAICVNDTPRVLSVLQAMQAASASPVAIVGQLTKSLLQEGAKHPEVFAIIDKLLEVPRAYSPHIKLVTVLAAATYGHSAPHTSPRKEPPKSSPLLATPPSVTIASASSAALQQAKKPTAQLAPAPTEPLTAMESADWEKVLTALQTSNPPLYAVAKQAQPSIADGALVLTFTFALHGKKIENPKQKAAIAAAIRAALGKTPAIRVVTDKNSTPPVITEDPAVAKVAAIMGGGELV